MIPSGDRVSWHLLARIEPQQSNGRDSETCGMITYVDLFSEPTPTVKLDGRWLELAVGHGREGVNHDMLWAINEIALVLAGSHEAHSCWFSWIRGGSQRRAGRSMYAELTPDLSGFLLDRWALYRKLLNPRLRPLGHPWLPPLSNCKLCYAPRVSTGHGLLHSKGLCLPCVGEQRTAQWEPERWIKDMAAIRAEDEKRNAGR